MEQKYRAVKDYQINIDYDIDKLRKIANNKILDGFNDFNDFKNNTPSMGIRTTLENELKISKTEVLNYLMGFPLNFKLKFFVKTLSNIWLDDMEMNGSTNKKIKYLISQKIEITNVGHIAELKFDFDKKKKLISQNFESTTHIDIQEFLAWAESKGFIIEKSQ